MQQSEHILNIYMHETAMQLEASQPDDESSGPTTAAHINALTSCLTSIHLALDTICSVEIRSMICLPTAALARTSYAVVALIKLYSLASTPDTKVGQVIDPASLKVEYYLDKVTSHYKIASEQDGGRALAKFSSVMNLLRSWFIKQKDRDPALREAFGAFSRPIVCADENDGREEPVCLVDSFIITHSTNQFNRPKRPLPSSSSARSPWAIKADPALPYRAHTLPTRRYPIYHRGNPTCTRNTRRFPVSPRPRPRPSPSRDSHTTSPTTKATKICRPARRRTTRSPAPLILAHRK